MKSTIVLIFMLNACTAMAGSDVGGTVEITANLTGGQISTATGVGSIAENYIGSLRNSSVRGNVKILANVKGGQIATATGVGSRATNSVASIH